MHTASSNQRHNTSLNSASQAHKLPTAITSSRFHSPFGTTIRCVPMCRSAQRHTCTSFEQQLHKLQMTMKWKCSVHKGTDSVHTLSGGVRTNFEQPSRRLEAFCTKGCSEPDHQGYERITPECHRSIVATILACSWDLTLQLIWSLEGLPWSCCTAVEDCNCLTHTKASRDYNTVRWSENSNSSLLEPLWRPP